MRAAIYSRFSSDLQNPRSCADQERDCRKFIEGKGWQFATAYSDHAISGSDLQRPGLQQLLKDAAAGQFAVVVAEALDRLSRDQEHIAGLYKRLAFTGVQIVTLSEREITPLHVGITGFMNAQFLAVLADKTRRGLRGQIESGRAAGPPPYGYRLSQKRDGNGDRIRGIWEIDEAEAAIVRRVFTEFADGLNAKQISDKLNEEGLRTRGDRMWTPQALYPNEVRQSGLLRHPVYIGRMVWGEGRWVKDPVTAKRVRRLSPASERLEKAVPKLRIIDQPLWDRVQQRMAGIRAATEAQRERLHQKARTGRRPVYLLSGLLKCTICGGNYALHGAGTYRCRNYTDGGKTICRNSMPVSRALVERLVLDAIRKDLLGDDAMALVKTALRKAIKDQAKHKTADQRRMEQELARANSKIVNLVTAIGEGGDKSKTLMAALLTAESDRDRLTAALRQPAPAMADVDKLLPGMVNEYTRLLGNLGKLTGAEMSRAREAVRLLVGDAIWLTPGKDEQGKPMLTAQLTGDYSGIIRLVDARKPLISRNWLNDGARARPISWASAMRCAPGGRC